ncbi:MAG: hypothetical protein WCF44_06075 [Candidatus Methylophosphatis roskildensis]
MNTKHWRTIQLPASLRAWNSPGFAGVLKQEIERLGAGSLPLQQGLTSSSYALDDDFEVMIIGVADEPGFILAHVGIFFSGIIAGCSCPDDPTPVGPQGEYCELRFTIDKATAATTVAPI